MTWEQMIKTLQDYGISNKQVLRVMREVDRADFVEDKSLAYADMPLQIAGGMTISQPFIVAEILEALRLEGDEKVLEIGTGSGYSAALTSKLAREVWTIEKNRELYQSASKRLQRFRNVHSVIGDGSLGLPGQAPYERIAVHAAIPEKIDVFLEQLAPSGLLIAPIRKGSSEILTRVSFRNGKIKKEELGSCFFIPLVGVHGF